MDGVADVGGGTVSGADDVAAVELVAAVEAISAELDELEPVSLLHPAAPSAARHRTICDAT